MSLIGSRGIKYKKRDFLDLILLLSVSAIVYLTGKNYLMMGGVLFSTIIIVKRAKVSFFSIFTVLICYSFLQEFIADISRLLAAGMLRSGIEAPVYFNELYICVQLYMIALLLVFSTTKILQNEKKIYVLDTSMSLVGGWIAVTLALMMIFLSYPSLPRLSASLSRHDGFIDSARYGPIAFFILGTTYDTIKKNKSIVIGWIIAIFWVLFHGERVVVFGLLIYVALKYLNNPKFDARTTLKAIFSKQYLKVYIAVLLFAVLGVYIQWSRVGVQNSEPLWHKLLCQGTCCDVVYVCNCAIDYIKGNSLFYGRTLIWYLIDLIPGTGAITNPMNAGVIISQQYFTVGGGLYFCEPIINFGIIGVLPYTIVVLLIFNKITEFSYKHLPYFWIPITMNVFRMVWYAGLGGWTTSAIYFAPVMYFIIRNINGRMRRERKII